MRNERPEYAVLFNSDGENVCQVLMSECEVRETIGEAPEVRIRGRLDRPFFSAPRTTTKQPRSLTPKTVIFNPPATIVLWEDGTKTVVKCDLRDDYVPLFGLALCYLKKSLGNTSRELNKTLRNAEREIENWRKQEEEK